MVGIVKGCRVFRKASRRAKAPQEVADAISSPAEYVLPAACAESGSDCSAPIWISCPSECSRVPADGFMRTTAGPLDTPCPSPSLRSLFWVSLDASSGQCSASRSILPHLLAASASVAIIVEAAPSSVAYSVTATSAPLSMSTVTRHCAPDACARSSSSQRERLCRSDSSGRGLMFCFSTFNEALKDN